MQTQTPPHTASGSKVIIEGEFFLYESLHSLKNNCIAFYLLYFPGKIKFINGILESNPHKSLSQHFSPRLPSTKFDMVSDSVCPSHLAIAFPMGVLSYNLVL